MIPYNPLLKPPLGTPINKARARQLGLVSYWLMNENGGPTVLDLSGNGNHGTLSGVTWTTGLYGPALNFGVGNFFVNCGHNPSLDITGEVTIIVAFTGADTGANVTLVGKEGKNTYWLNTYSDELQFYTGGKAAYSSAGLIADNVPVIVAVTRNNAEDLSKFYFNGVFDVSSDAGGNIGSYPANDLYFGIDPRDETGLEFVGMIDFVMLYNRALSASEIALLYREPFWLLKNSNEEAILGGYTAAPPAGIPIFRRRRAG